jgi:hypothetical protein
MTPPVTVDDARKMKVVELREALHALGLPTSGLKAELLARLEDAIRASEEPSDEAEEEEEEDDDDEEGSGGSGEEENVEDDDDDEEGSQSASESEGEMDDALARRIRASASKSSGAREEEDEDEEEDEEDEDEESASEEASSDGDDDDDDDDSESESQSDSDSNAIEQIRRRAGEPVLNDAATAIVARALQAECALKALKRDVDAGTFRATDDDEKFIEELRQGLIKIFDAPLPTLESEAKRQREEKEKRGEYGLPMPSESRGETLRAMPRDGWNRQRKKERVKLKKNDPSAQGTYDTRKMIEDGAGLFVAPQDPSKVNRELRKMERKTAGKGWFDMKAVEYTPELRREMRMLKLRGAYDPKRFYKNADTSKLPTHFQMGTVIGGAADYYSARLAKKDQKRTLAEEIMADKDIERVRRHRFAKIQEKNAGNMGRKSKRRNADKGKGKHKRPKI